MNQSTKGIMKELQNISRKNGNNKFVISKVLSPEEIDEYISGIGELCDEGYIELNKNKINESTEFPGKLYNVKGEITDKGLEFIQQFK